MGCGEPSCAIASRCFLTSVVSGSVPAPSHPRPRPRVKHPQDSPLICRGCSHSHLQTQPPRRTTMQKLRIVTVGVSGGRSLTWPFRDVSLDKIVARAEGYSFAATVWDLSIVEGPFLRPVPKPFDHVTIRSLTPAVRPASLQPSRRAGRPLAPAPHAHRCEPRTGWHPCICITRINHRSASAFSFARPTYRYCTDSRSARLGQHLGEDPPLCS